MSTRIRRLIAAAAVVFGFATGAAAQSTAFHRGVVQDHRGAPVPGVVVTVQHPQDTAVRVVLTNLHGEYEVGDLEHGVRYRLQVSHPEFRKTRLQASADDHVIVRLKPRRPCRSAAVQATAVARQ
jgi:hypothetical protein